MEENGIRLKERRKTSLSKIYDEMRGEFNYGDSQPLSNNNNQNNDHKNTLNIIKINDNF